MYPDFCKISDDSSESHRLCMFKCNLTTGALLSCCNPNEQCKNIAHATCSNLNPEMINFLSFWYCKSCLEQEPELNAAYGEELTGAIAISTLFQLISTRQIKPSELPGLMKQKDNTTRAAIELSNALDELEVKDSKLLEAQQQIESLKRQLEQQKPATMSQFTPVATQAQSGSASNVLSLDEVVQRARRRRESSELFEREQPNVVGFNLPSTSQSQRYSTPFPHAPNDATIGSLNSDDPNNHYATFIAESANSYPDYDAQEENANALGTDRLALLRAHITDPQPFSGDVATWATFRTLFVGSSRRGYYRAVEDMERLRKLIIGDAYRMYGTEIVDAFAHPVTVLRKLDNFYGIKGNAVRHHLDSIWNLKRVEKVNDRDLLLNLFATVKQYALLCRQYNQIAELTAESSLLLIENRMHQEHVVTWRNYATNNKLPLSVDTIILFLEEQLRTIQQKPIANKPKNANDHVLLAHSTEGHEARKNTSYEQKRKRGNKSSAPKPHKCFNCQEEHPFFKCPQLSSVSVPERVELVKRLKVCECCLSAKRHNAASCTRERKCPVMGCEIRKKHPLLHGHSNNQIKDYVFSGFHKVMTIKHNRVPVLFKVVPGHAVSTNGELLPINVLFDTGSGLSLSDMSLLSRAGWPSREYELAMKWTSDVIRTESNARLHDVVFIPYNRKHPVVFKGVTAIDNLELPEQKQDPAQIKHQFPYLSKVPIPTFDKQRPQILLGLPHAKFMAAIQTIKDPDGCGPIAELSELGWTVSGTRPDLGIESMRDPEVVGFTLVHSNPSNDDNVDSLIELLKQQFSMDSLGIRGQQTTCMSADDRKAVGLIENSLKFVPEEGRYEIGLFWRNENCTMPDNYKMALNRLQAAESRLKKLGLEKTINDQFKAEKESGQLIKVTREELNLFKRVNFVPGFVTFNYNKIPPKARWVNDTAATCQGVSLNSKLLKGPDNLVPLPQALCALREGEIALLADVKKMFNQILMRKEDQYCQLCLWRDCDSSREPEIFRQTRVIFGPTCSPAAANAVRIRHAETSSTKHPEAAEAALHQMYMDDVLDSRDTLEDAKRVALDLISMFDEIGWELTQFQSNSKELLSKLPPERVSEKMLELDIEHSEPLITKVLGMFYDPRNDQFMFKLNDDKLLKKCLTANYHPTRKEMISLVMRVYDPLGLISHFLIHGRLLLQEMCRRGVDWKEKIPEEMYLKWLRWLTCFDQISKLTIPRRYTPIPLGNCTITMHLFVDASQDAYSCALYLRFDYGHAIYVKLMAAKSRVAPIKQMTIPRLELNSALIGARLLSSAKLWQRRLKIREYTAWSDSITVLRWLYAGHIKHKQFVAPRIAEIQELTSVKAWRYVPTDLNVADLATKWCDIDFSDKHHRWYNGPDFLYKPPEQWPQLPSDFSQYITDEDPEKGEKVIERVLILKSLDEVNPWQAGIFNNVSASIRADWDKYVKIVAFALRFVDKIKALYQKSANQQPCDTLITKEEQYRAENLIIKQVQLKAFTNEYKSLSKGLCVASSSTIKNLSPFLCQTTGLIRAKTRLSASFPPDTRYPPIMPNLHETSDAIVRHYHKKHKHVGDNAIIGEIRSRVWIVNARRAVKRERARCIFCIVKRAKPAVPETAELPEFRLDPTKKPFYFTGVDCFGPFEVYSGNSRRKKSIWMVIFTCLITRAVYLEVLDDMSTNCMIAAIEKLWARRGPIGHMYSDNGRNFLGTSNILENLDFQNKLSDKRVKWHFQPPYTPNFGGVWERLIKDIKRALEASVGSFPIPRIALESALAQIECNMNDRPLTDMPVSPDDLEPLTPNLLMSGQNSYPFLSNHDISINDLISTKYVRCAKAVVQAYMKRWTHEALPEIAKHKLQKKPAHYIKMDDFVIYIDPSKLPSEWKRGIVCNVYKGKDRKVRVVDVRFSNGEVLKRRSVARLAKLDFRFDHKTAEQQKYDTLTAEKDSKIVTANENSNIPQNVENIVLVTAPESSKISTAKFNLNFEPHSSLEPQNKENSQERNLIKIRKLSRNSLKFQLDNSQIDLFDMDKDLRIAASPIGVLSATDYKKFIDPDQRRVVYVTNIPQGTGLVEIWQALRSFGEIVTIMVPFWNATSPFHAFVIYCREEAARNAIKFSRSFAIGLKDTYHRVVIESPIKHINPLNRRQNKDLDGLFMTFENDGIISKLLIVRAKQGNLNNKKIPLSCNAPVVRRQLNHDRMYDFVYYQAETTDPVALSKIALPTRQKANRNSENDDNSFDLATIAHQSIVFENKLDEFDYDMGNIGLINAGMGVMNNEDTLERSIPIPTNQVVHTLADTRKVKSFIVKVSKKRNAKAIRKTKSFSGRH